MVEHGDRAEPPLEVVLQRPDGERRVRVEHPGTTALIQVVYHTPSAASPDMYPLMVADALLSGAKPLGMGGGGGRSARRRVARRSLRASR